MVKALGKRRPKRVFKTKKTRRMKPRVRKVKFQHALQAVYRTALKYIDTKTFTLSSTTVEAYQVFRLNDLYDPDLTALGHQAKYRDQFYNLYGKARCMGFSIKLTLVSDGIIPIMISAGPCAQNFITSHESFSEDRGVKRRLLTTTTPTTIKYRSYTDRHLSNRRGTWKTDDLFEQPSGNALDNDATCWYALNCKRFLPLHATASSIFCEIQIFQFVEFSSPIPYGQS